MVSGIFHSGSGLGNQLFRYVATRVLALDMKGNWEHSFGMVDRELFKGASFMNLDMGIPIGPPSAGTKIGWKTWNEKKLIENGVDVRDYDPEIKLVTDGTYIDGEFQDPRYFEHRLDEVREWLKVEPAELPDSACVINFRGGEYSLFPDLFLPREYWDEAIKMMLEINPNMQFNVHTDDPVLASTYFPDYPVIHDIGMNWRAIRYAPYLILSNSSFAILPALLGDAKKILAPKYWAGHNKGFWQLRQNQYKKFTYV